jgi:hypothetical protein
MQSSFFWQNWPRDQRIIWNGLSVIFLCSILYLWINYFNGANGVIEWEKLQEQKTIETTVHQFRLGPFNLAIPGESYVIFEYLAGSEVHHNFIASYIFLAVFSLAVVILLSIVTTLEGFWYFLGMSIFIILVVSLRFDVLLIFRQRLAVPVAILVLYSAASFYYKYIRTFASLSERILIFLAMTTALGLVIAFFSRTDYPFVHLLATAYPLSLILSILFIITVAHEILVSFVYISTQAGRESSARHFSIISFIYMINVVITCLHEIGAIDWNFLYLNLYLLLTISALLGVWGFRLREPQYENIFSFQPVGAYFFVALGSICFITIAKLLGNHNDAALRIIRDVIIFTHTGFGIIFLIYFFSNFLVMMADGNPVYRILYRPNRMPYFTFRFAGLIATLAFVFYSNWHEYVYHGIAGFYNYIGDLYVLQDNEAFGQSFYEQSGSRAFQNNRANYALGVLRTGRLDFEKAQRNYELANGKRPTEFSLVNGGNLFLWTERYFDAIDAFRTARKKDPHSTVISNNLGYAFAKVHAIDSASYYLNLARAETLTKTSAEMNFFGMAAVEYIPVDSDSVMESFKTDSRAVAANALTLATLLRQKVRAGKDPLSQKTLDLYSATYLNNYIIHHAKEVDTTWISTAFQLISDSTNLAYREALLASVAHAYYHRGNVHKAFEILGGLTYMTQDYKGKFNYLMGLWALEQGDPAFAASYFAFAESVDYKFGKFYRAIALTESGKTTEALVSWDSLAMSNDMAVRNLALQMKRILTLETSNAFSLSDHDKYQFCRYRIGLHDTTVFRRLSETFENPNYKAQALLDMSGKLFKADRVVPAISFFNRIGGLKLTDKKLYDDIRHLELLMLASRGELSQLAAQINKGVEFDQEHELHKLLYAAMLSEANGDFENAARNYGVLAKANPFFEESIIAAANFFRSQDVKSIKAYSILTDAIYLNRRSVKLLKAYAAEASRQGFDEYASSAVQTLMEVEAGMR